MCRSIGLDSDAEGRTVTLEQELSTKLQTLYAKIPLVENCKPGCTDCCGPVPFSIIEAAKVKTTPGLATCIDCKFGLHGKCDVYSNRPLMCRLFGAVDAPHLTCPHGAKSAKLLTVAEGNAIVNEYLAIQEQEQGLLPSVEDELADLRRRRHGKK